MSALGLQRVTEQDIDALAQEMADRESTMLYSTDPKAVLDLAVDPRGNYAAETLLHLLRSKTKVSVERWRPSQPLSSCALLLGSGDHWQAVLMDKDKQWFVLERITKHAIQNLVRFLSSKQTNGAVYEVGLYEILPNPSYLNSITCSQHRNILTTRSQRDMLIVSPPRKRQHVEVVESFVAPEAMNQDDFVVPFDVDFQVKVTTPENSSDSLAGPQVCSTLPGVILPSDFQQNPRFQFEGPQVDRIFDQPQGNKNPDDNAMDVLLEAMTPETSGETEDQPRRSTRVRSQPHLYQFDEVEREEKNKH